MNKKVRILGKTFPAWLLVGAMVASGAGAAAGTVLAGKVTGEIPVAVSQSLLTEAPIWLTSLPANDNQPQQVNTHVAWVHKPNRSIGVVSDDNTGFQAAAELAVGDWAAFHLPLKNASSNDLVAELTLRVPCRCLDVEVYNATSCTNITDVVRVGRNTWKFKVLSDAEYGATDWLTVVISTDDNCRPGYYTISGKIQQIEY
ncbi:MAG: hypothetical protein J7K77_01225 [Dehalococcoidales bacterium]|nr:hypothetical protein [Dehalococcoidales bacterium]